MKQRLTVSFDYKCPTSNIYLNFKRKYERKHSIYSDLNKKDKNV